MQQCEGGMEAGMSSTSSIGNTARKNELEADEKEFAFNDVWEVQAAAGGQVWLCPTIRGGKKNVPRENSRSEGDCEVISKPCQRENLSLLQGKCRSLAGWLAACVERARFELSDTEARARWAQQPPNHPLASSLALRARVYFLSAAQSRRIHFVCLKRYSSLFFYIYVCLNHRSPLLNAKLIFQANHKQKHTRAHFAVYLTFAGHTTAAALSLLTAPPGAAAATFLIAITPLFLFSAVCACVKRFSTLLKYIYACIIIYVLHLTKG